jgi:hypothetical protein
LSDTLTTARSILLIYNLLYEILYDAVITTDVGMTRGYDQERAL